MAELSGGAARPNAAADVAPASAAPAPPAPADTYVLATGLRGEARLALSEQIYGPQTRALFAEVRRRHVAPDAGLRLVSFGCGSGAQLASLCDLVGPEGSLLLVDVSDAQLAGMWRAQAADLPPVASITLRQGDVMALTGSGDHDVAYARFLLVHLPAPAQALRQMATFVRPGGLVLADEHDVGDIRGLPPAAPLAEFVGLLNGLARSRGVDFRAGARLPALFAAAGLTVPAAGTESGVALVVADRRCKALTVTSLEEGLPSYAAAGLADPDTLQALVQRLWGATLDDGIKICVGSQWQYGALR